MVHRRRPGPSPGGRWPDAAVVVVVVLATVLATVLAAAALPRAGHAAVPTATAGGHSGGDPLFPTAGNTGYDVSHYTVALRYLAGGRIEGTTTVTARAAHRLSSFSLDLQGLRVHSVRVDGSGAGFRRLGAKLVVTPVRPVRGRFTATIRYGGRPVPIVDADGTREGWVATDDGATVVAEPLGAMTWFPDNDTPRDKATFTLRVSAPSGLAVAGNGRLAGRRTRGRVTTWTWRQPVPMAPYLATVSIGRFRVVRTSLRTTSGRRLPAWSFVDPRFGSQRVVTASVPGVLRFLERRFGPYPMSSAGVVVDDLRVGYALETQDRPVFDGPPDASTLVHEVAHQWYGDSVTVRSWGDIWLSEAFATYAEQMWQAAHGGPSVAQWFRDLYAEHPADSALWRPAPTALTDPADLFGPPVYERGAMTLQVLRERVGDEAFFTVLRRWAADHRHGHGTTAQLTALAERVSGQDLDVLFRDWLSVPGRPEGYAEPPTAGG